MSEVVAGPWTWWWTVAIITAAVLHAVIRKAHGWACTALLGAGRRARLPPGDMGWPIVGNMWAFLMAFKFGKPDDFITSYHRRFGRVGLYRAFMFSSPTIMVTTPETCKKVLMDDVGFVPGWPKSTADLIGSKSFLGMTYEEHRRVRKLTAAPINGLDALTTYLGFIDETVVSTLGRLSEAGTKEVEFLTEIRRMTFQIIMQVFMSGADDRTVEVLQGSYRDLNLGVRAMAIDLPGFAYHRALKARKKLVSVLQGVLDERRAGRSARASSMDMMDRLLKVKDEQGRMLEDEDIIDILIMYLNAGHESTGRITMWATVFLQENPEVLARAKAEQEEIMRNIPPTQKKRLNVKDYKKMKYLSQVIDETLRIINVGFVVFRQATRDVDVNGYLIPKGWKVQVWFRSLHTDPQVHSDPYKFNPSRWEGPPPRAGTFLPFGLGTRSCPGNELAKLEISVFLHHFLLGYKITRTNPNCRTAYLPHARPADNCMATITKL